MSWRSGMRNILSTLVVVVAACGQHAAPGEQPAAKPVEAPANPAVPAPAEIATKPTPAQVAPAADPPPGIGTASEAEQDLIANLDNKTELGFVAPSGETIKVAAKKYEKAGTWFVDLVVGGKVIESYDTKIETDDLHYQARAVVGAWHSPAGDGVVFVTGATKITGKPDDRYEARVLIWSADKQRLVVTRSIKFAATYDPSAAT